MNKTLLTSDGHTAAKWWANFNLNHINDVMSDLDISGLYYKIFKSYHAEIIVENGLMIGIKFKSNEHLNLFLLKYG